MAISKDTKIEDLYALPIYIKLRLMKYCKTVEDLLDCSVDSLLKINGLRLLDIAIIKRCLNEHDFHLINEDVIDITYFDKPEMKELIDKTNSLVRRRDSISRGFSRADITGSVLNNYNNIIGELNNDISKLLNELKAMNSVNNENNLEENVLASLSVVNKNNLLRYFKSLEEVLKYNVRDLLCMDYISPLFVIELKNALNNNGIHLQGEELIKYIDFDEDCLDELNDCNKLAKKRDEFQTPFPNPLKQEMNEEIILAIKELNSKRKEDSELKR